MYAYLGTHKHTHIFLIRLVFTWNEICTNAQTGGWNHKWHSFRRLYDYGIGIAYFCSVVHFCTKWNSLYLPPFLLYTLCIRNAKERGEMLNELLSTRHIYTIKQRWTPKPIDYLCIHFVPYTNNDRACVCASIFIIALLQHLALNSSGPSLFPLNSFACVRVRARAHAFSLLYRTKCINLEFYADNRSSTTKIVRRRKCIATEIFECLSVDLRVCMYVNIQQTTNLIMKATKHKFKLVFRAWVLDCVVNKKQHKPKREGNRVGESSKKATRRNSNIN